MRDYMNLGLRLFVICLVAALALAGVNSITKPIIDQQEKDKLNAARRELIAEAEDFTEVDFEFAKAAYPDRFADISVYDFALNFYREVYGVDAEQAAALRSHQLLDWMKETGF